jgi:molybdopterin biosynthesis enzyme
MHGFRPFGGNGGKAGRKRKSVVWSGTHHGQRDFVPEVLSGLQPTEVKLNLGRLMVFVKSQGHPCFALPGKTMSAFVMMELFVKPFIYEMMGHRWASRMENHRLAGSITRGQCLWDNWTPVRLGPQGAQPLNKKGAYPVLEETQGIMFFPPHLDQLAAGATVKVLRLSGADSLRSGDP